MATRLYVGHLPRDARERDLDYFFRSFGPIRDLVVKNGFGFVEFEDWRDAEDALFEMNGRNLLGQKVSVERTKRPPKGRDAERSRYSYGGRHPDPNPYRDERRYQRRYPPRRPSKYGPSSKTKHRATVENLSSRISWQDLKDFFREAADVTYADAHTPRRNEGIVCFATAEDMKRAIQKLDGKEINGRKVRIIPDEEENGETYGKRKSSRTRSRSNSDGDRKRARRSESKTKSRSGSPNNKVKDDDVERSEVKKEAKAGPVENGEENSAEKREKGYWRSISGSPGGKQAQGEADESRSGGSVSPDEDSVGSGGSRASSSPSVEAAEENGRE